MPAAAHPAADSEPLLLAIESSCDETAAAVIARQLVIRSNIVASQIDLHAEFGGVVPEIASRAHLRNILPVLEQALDSARVTLEQITAVAVVTEPGLGGPLLVGLEKPVQIVQLGATVSDLLNLAAFAAVDADR